MNERVMNDEAISIQRRANALGVSIASICRYAGVSRTWFENFKERTPKAVVTLNKVEQVLGRLELERKKPS